MEIKPDGIHLTIDEANELASVFIATAWLNPASGYNVPKLPTDQERNEAYGLRDHIVDNLPGGESNFVLTPDLYPPVRRIAELALANVNAVMAAGCKGGFAYEYHPENRGTTLRALATTADISEEVRKLLPPTERT